MNLGKLGVNQSSKKYFVEHSMCIPIYDVFYKEWVHPASMMEKDDTISTIAKILKVNINEEIVTIHRNSNEQTIDVFHSDSDLDTFISFDHFNDPTDQNDMIGITVRFKLLEQDIILPLLLKLYMKNAPRCNYEIDYWNQSTYSMVFNRDFYIERVEKYKHYQVYYHNINL